MSLPVRPFKIHIPDEQIVDLRRRLRDARLPGTIFRSGAEDGISLPFMRRLLEHWRDEFDWRAQETRLNQVPQFTATVDGQDIHFIHVRGKGPGSRPLILTHGWPGCFTEFEALVPRLTDPAAFGGDQADAFDVVVPSLPGFGFSAAPTETGTSSRRVADLWHGLMQQLGYGRYYAQGGDIGAGVSTWLAVLYPKNVLGVHLNYISAAFRPPMGPDLPPMTEEELAFFARQATFAAEEGAYSALQSTKPQTLAFALADSPVGLAAWMAEKFTSWTDHDGDFERIVPVDRLLTIISIYWFGNSLDASLRIYKENRLNPIALADFPAVDVPFSVAHFPRELPIPPRSWVERGLRVVRWTEMPRGGHFAALEQPGLLAEDIRAAFGRDMPRLG